MIVRMNFDLITKLAKLANNNPNENEANLAARKVCKLLADSDYKFVAGTTNKNTQDANRNTQGTSQRTASQYQKSKSGSWTGSNFDPDTFSDIFGDIFKNYYYKEPTQPPKQPKRPESDYVKWDPYDKGEVKNNKEKRPLTCRSCGKIVMTGFVGPSVIFECTECQWVGYKNDYSK